LEAEIERIGPERVAAFFVEPVIGAGGVYPPPPGYVERVREICTRHGVLLVIDSVICGFGRLGDWFGVDRFGIVPDLVTFAKGITSGYVQLGGVVAHERVAEPFFADGAAPFRHGATYSGHPTACAAAMANLDIMENEGLLKRADGLELPLYEAVQSLADHPLVAEARGGTGALAAIELDPERVAANPGLPGAVAAAARRRGGLVRPMGSALAVAPALTFTGEHVELMVEGLRGGLDDASCPPRPGLRSRATRSCRPGAARRAAARSTRPPGPRAAAPGCRRSSSRRSNRSACGTRRRPPVRPRPTPGPRRSAACGARRARGGRARAWSPGPPPAARPTARRRSRAGGGGPGRGRSRTTGRSRSTAAAPGSRRGPSRCARNAPRWGPA